MDLVVVVDGPGRLMQRRRGCPAMDLVVVFDGPGRLMQRRSTGISSGGGGRRPREADAAATGGASRFFPAFSSEVACQVARDSAYTLMDPSRRLAIVDQGAGVAPLVLSIHVPVRCPSLLMLLRNKGALLGRPPGLAGDDLSVSIPTPMLEQKGFTVGDLDPDGFSSPIHHRDWKLGLGTVVVLLSDFLFH